MAVVESLRKLEIILANCEVAITNEVPSSEFLSLDMVTTWEPIRNEVRALLNEVYHPEFKPLNNWEKEVEDVTRIDDYLWAHLMTRDIRIKGIDPDEAQRAENIAAGLLNEESQVSAIAALAHNGSGIQSAGQVIRNEGIKTVTSIWANKSVNDTGRSIQEIERPNFELILSTEPSKSTQARTRSKPFSKPTSQVPPPHAAKTPSSGPSNPNTLPARTQSVVKCMDRMQIWRHCLQQ
ncbi:hypothetical protein FRC01_003499 [Tulasnella sp. 417]|nr:hypothetical protein FRC01_003499 [Tulasnella sp. 417]